MARWALSTGRPADRDALAAISGALAAGTPGRAGPGSSDGPDRTDAPTVWTVDRISTLLWVTIPEWCDAVGVELPDRGRLADTLDTYLRHLSAHRRIAVGSDPVASMRRTITDFRGTRSNRHPSLQQGQNPARLAPVVPIA
ncbi:MAG: hypothetical protein JST64_05645 [Actinobacteria bacterium]|nr:hypothetical protein [Actinomycetota bacterium]